MKKADKKILKEFGWSTLSYIIIAMLTLLSCNNRDVTYVVSIEKTKKYLPTDSLIFDATDSTDKEVLYINSDVEVYEVCVKGEFDVEDYVYESFSEIDYVLDKEDIDSLTCALKGKVKSDIDNYYELRDLERKLEESDCN